MLEPRRRITSSNSCEFYDSSLKLRQVCEKKREIISEPEGFPPPPPPHFPLQEVHPDLLWQCFWQKGGWGGAWFQTCSATFVWLLPASSGKHSRPSVQRQNTFNEQRSVTLQHLPDTLCLGCRWSITNDRTQVMALNRRCSAWSGCSSINLILAPVLLSRCSRSNWATNANCFLLDGLDCILLTAWLGQAFASHCRQEIGSSPHTGLLHRQISPLFACPSFFFQAYTFFLVRGQKVTYVGQSCKVNYTTFSATSQSTSRYWAPPQSSSLISEKYAQNCWLSSSVRLHWKIWRLWSISDKRVSC